ncbi:MAG: mechanosensitive ion channel domain-containing protein [Cyanobacteria bacterium P01_G01_bin.54]
MIKLILIRTRKTLIFTASVITLTTAIALPAIPQAVEGNEDPESVLVESTIVGDVDPSQAVSVEDLTIPVDQLELLVKPLTLEELQTEAAAWFLLLKSKVQEISTTEIAIKRENAVIQQEQETAKAIEEAKTKLTEAEAALKTAEPGTSEHEKATQNLEDAKNALLAAEQSVEELKAATEELEADAEIQDVVEEAETEEEISQANKALKEAEQERDKLEAGSAEYQTATEKIDALTVAIVNLEAIEGEVTAAVPGSPEFVEAEKNVDQAQAKVIQASAAVINAGLAPTLLAEQPEIESEAADAALNKVAEDVGNGTQEAAGEDGTATNADGAAATPETSTTETPASPQNEAEAAGEAAEGLEGIDETLEEVAEAEADLKNQLVANVAELQTEQTALIERFKVVLDALEQKGGDTTSYRKYIDAVSGIELDIQDTEGLAVRLTTWLKSEEGGMRWGINIATFVGIVLASAILAELLALIFNRILRRFGGVSDLFRQFLVVVTKRGVLVIGTLLALTSLGVSLGPILALVGGASFVLAFALQSNLGNFASGLMLLVTKPFDVGDEVDLGGHWAFVESISLANTCVKDFDDNLLYLPNNIVWGSEIKNYTHSEYRRFRFVLHVRLSQDLKVVSEMWNEITANHPAVVDDPAPSMSVGANSVIPLEYFLVAKLTAVTKTDGYWGVYKEVLYALQEQLVAKDIEIAIPGMELEFSSAAAVSSPLTNISPVAENLPPQ